MIKGEIDCPRYAGLWLALVAGSSIKNIARKWGVSQPLTLKEWEKDLDWCQRAEEIVYKRRMCQEVGKGMGTLAQIQMLMGVPNRRNDAIQQKS